MASVQEDPKVWIKLLGSNNVKEIQDAITAELIDNIRDSIQHEWIVMPDNWQAMFEDIGEEVILKMKKRYKQVLTDAIENKLNEFVEKTAKYMIEVKDDAK